VKEEANMKIIADSSCVIGKIEIATNGKKVIYHPKLVSNDGYNAIYEIDDDFPEWAIKTFFGPDAVIEGKTQVEQAEKEEPQEIPPPDFVRYFKQDHPSELQELKQYCLNLLHAIDNKDWKFFETSCLQLADVLDKAEVWQELWKRQTLNQI
jgi:hypothetical protein